MIRVLVKKEVPFGKVECGNCGSLLEYGNSDLSKVYPENTLTTQYLYKQPYFAFRCPVCGLDVQANWVFKDVNKDDKLEEAAE
jgi:transcription elongation factor Elf1